MKKRIIGILIFVASLLAIAAPFAGTAIYGAMQPHVYEKTYYAAPVDKYNLLERRRNDKKIILVGSSNVAFGFDSGLIKSELPDYEVVNFGLYGALGTKIMIDLSRNFIQEGDLVFLSPEINAQSMSLYFNGMNTLKATEDRFGIVNKLPEKDRKSVYGSVFDFIDSRRRNPEIIEPAGVYQRKNFNEYGDISYFDEEGNSLRSQNLMPLHYDPTTNVDFTMEPDKDFTDYVNAFNKDVLKKKARLYYCFSPVNADKHVTSAGKEGLDADILSFYWNIRNALDCEVIGNPFEYLIDPHYFYDSNFHMNDAGAILRTQIFLEDYYRDALLLDKKLNSDVPPQPDYPSIDVEDRPDSESAIYFDYSENGSGLEIVSLKGEGLELSEIVLPEVYDHKPVIGIGERAFAGSRVLQKLIVPIDYYAYFVNSAFDGCASLKSVYIGNPDPTGIIVDFTGGLLGDVSSDFRFYVPEESLDAYRADYYWQAYYEYLAGY